MQNKKTLYLFPCPIDDDNNDTLSKRSIELLHETKSFIVERAKTARRFIKSTNPPFAISEIEVEELDKHDAYNNETLITDFLKKNSRVGVISEAGCPGIADPGALIVQKARMQGYKIIPLVGPSSIILSLMASGLNGQDFRFHGYLPVKEGLLRSKLKYIQTEISREKNAHIFIETPYRNQKLYNAILKTMNSQTILSISINLTNPEEYIDSKPIGKWTTSKIDVFSKKLPCVFILGNY